MELDAALDAFLAPPLDRVQIDLDLKIAGREDEVVDALRERGLIERASISTQEVSAWSSVAASSPRCGPAGPCRGRPRTGTRSAGRAR